MTLAIIENDCCHIFKEVNMNHYSKNMCFLYHLNLSVYNRYLFKNLLCGKKVKKNNVARTI